MNQLEVKHLRQASLTPALQINNQSQTTTYQTNSDQAYLEHLYSKITDKNGVILDRFGAICDQLDIESTDILKKQLEDFSEGGKIDIDIAKVRYDYHNKRRINKLMQLHDELQKLKKSITADQRVKKVYKMPQTHLRLEPLIKQQNQSAGGQTINHMQQSTSVHNKSGFFMTDLPSQFQNSQMNQSIMNGSTKMLGAQTFYSINAQFDIDGEKQKMNRYIKIKEKSEMQREAYGQKMEELWKNKELKFQQIEEKIKKNLKEKSKRFKQLDSLRYQKREELTNKSTLLEEQADSEYYKYLEDLKAREQMKNKLLKEQNEQEFKDYQRNFMKSQSNFSTYRKILKQQAHETTLVLDTLESKLNSHREKSELHKEHLKQHISHSLSRISQVQENLRLRQEAAEEYRLKTFLDRQEKIKTKLEIHEKQKLKALSQRSRKQEQRRMNQSQIQESEEYSQVMLESQMAKQEQVQGKIEEIRRKRQKEIELKQERQALMLQDQKRKIEKQKTLKQKQRAKLLEKYQVINEKVNQLRINKASHIEFSRLSNEVQQQKINQQFYE
eukprot:403349206